MILRNDLLGIFLAMAVSLFMLIFLSWLAYDRVQETGRRTESVNHSYRVRLKNKDLTNTLSIIEIGHRGYLLSGQEKYLYPYAEGRNKLKKVTRDFRLLVRDNPLQLRRLDTINMLIERHINLIELNISRIKAKQHFDGNALEEGRKEVDKIRVISRHFEEDELQLLNQRAEMQKIADRNTNFYLLLLSVVSLAFLLIFFRLLYVELSRRISFQKTLEEKLTDLERANAELEQFAYVASHDLQEPLRKIRAFGERLILKQYDQLTEDGKANLSKINQSANRMQQLIDDLLLFSRTANMREKIFQDIDLNALLKRIQEEFSDTISKKKVTIKSVTLPVISGIEFQIIQLFNNLISNAIKYSKPDTPPVIEIAYTQVLGESIEGINTNQKENIYHRISFIDNGIGFDPIYAEKIFVIFQRLHNRSEYEGTGIGLALCRRIVSNHNGFIVAEAKPNQEGAIFHIYLPVTNHLAPKL